ncbi:hypothetical protein [Bifidobacterium miconisargentati]|uniref:hypothetical protein n=1 Tax=Bifidobacterium miconisargentati TaxID=2834437 RepID=UPI001BDBC80B|nr:hypothetical protein [Bifidobacterium miconisargentati]MBW3090061.1 hypothetical protein [Bifidobacterium miconisargentati]
MSFLSSLFNTYDVIREGWCFLTDEAVLEDVSIDEAEDYADRHSGFFSGDGRYKIARHGDR